MSGAESLDRAVARPKDLSQSLEGLGEAASQELHELAQRASATKAGWLDRVARRAVLGRLARVQDGWFDLEDEHGVTHRFGAPAADVDDGTGSGTPDGGVTIDDLLYYLFRFENGC